MAEVGVVKEESPFGAAIAGAAQQIAKTLPEGTAFFIVLCQRIKDVPESIVGTFTNIDILQKLSLPDKLTRLAELITSPVPIQ